MLLLWRRWWKMNKGKGCRIMNTLANTSRLGIFWIRNRGKMNILPITSEVRISPVRIHNRFYPWYHSIFPHMLSETSWCVPVFFEWIILPIITPEPPSLTAETIGAETGCFLYLLRSTESWSGVGKVWASWECSINQIMYLGNILLLYIVPFSKIRISTSFCTWGIFFFFI